MRVLSISHLISIKALYYDLFYSNSILFLVSLDRSNKYYVSPGMNLLI
jgi:hypothetical protein